MIKNVSYMLVVTRSHIDIRDAHKAVPLSSYSCIHCHSLTARHSTGTLQCTDTTTRRLATAHGSSLYRTHQGGPAAGVSLLETQRANVRVDAAHSAIRWAAHPDAHGQVSTQSLAQRAGLSRSEPWTDHATLSYVSPARRAHAALR